MIQILPKSGSCERVCQLKEYYVVGRKKKPMKSTFYVHENVLPSIKIRKGP